MGTLLVREEEVTKLMTQFRCVADGATVSTDRVMGRFDAFDTDTARAFAADCPACGASVVVRAARFDGTRP